MKPRIVMYRGRWHMWQGGSTWAQNIAATNWCIHQNRHSANEQIRVEAGMNRADILLGEIRVPKN